ncbi:MAG: hypothetical protein JWO68_4031, partial [Actinomycetia bacterium]|nr:hypothetical protein [Actinomycetes bacterium]
TTDTGSLEINWGSDNDPGLRSVAFATGLNTNAVVNTGNGALTSNGKAVLFVRVSDTELLGVADDDGNGSVDANGRVVFRVTLDDGANPTDEGAWKFTLLDNLDHQPAGNDVSLAINLGFTATDADGDPASSSFTVTINDDTATIGPISAQTLAEVTANGGSNTFQAQTLSGVSLNIDWASDNNDPDTGTVDRKVAFASALANSVPAGIESNGYDLVYRLSADGTTLTAYRFENGHYLTGNGGDLGTSPSNSARVFEVQLNDDSNGTYRFTLHDNLDHSGASGTTIPLTFGFTATDSDGDQTAVSNFTVNVTDDVPVVVGAAIPVTVGEINLPFAQAQTASLGIDWNADDGAAKHILFARDPVSGNPVLPVGLTSDGVQLAYDVHLVGDNEVLFAYKVGDVPGPTTYVFSVAFTEGNPVYTFTLYQNLDHAGPGTDTKSIDFSIRAFDSDGDYVDQTFTVKVTDDVPVAQNDAPISLAEDAADTGGNVLANDTKGADGATLTHVDLGAGYVAITTGSNLGGGVYQFTTANGVYTFNADGAWTFNPNLNLNNPAGVSAGFNYRITDGDGDTSTATQSVTVTDGVNPSVAGAISITVQEAALDPTKAGNDIAAGHVTGTNAASTAETNQSSSVVFTAHSDNITGIAFGSLAGISVAGVAAGATFTWVVNGGQLEGHIGTAAGPIGIILAISGTTTATAGGGTAAPTITATLTDHFVHASGNGDVTITGIKIVATDTDGDTAIGNVSVTVQDDVPAITVGAVQNGSVDEERLSGGNAGDSYGNGGDLTTAQGDDGDLTASGALGINFGADGPAAVTTGGASTTTYAFTGTATLSPDLIVTQGTVNHASAPGFVYGGNTAPIIINANDSKPFTLESVNLGMFGTAGTTASVVLTGFNVNGTVVATYTTNVALVGSLLGGEPTLFNATGTPFAGVLIDRLQIATINTFAGYVMADNLKVSQNGTGSAVVDGPLTFTDHVDAAANVSVLNSNGDPINLANLTSHGAVVHFALLDATTLVAYTGPTAPTTIGGANVVFSTVLSASGSGSYNFVLKGSLDHPLGDTEDDLIFKFSYTAKDSDGDATPGSFTVTVDDDGPVQTAAVLTASAYESELSTATGDQVTGTQAGAADDKNGVAGTDDTIVTGALSSLVKFGADGVGAYTVETTGLATSLTSLTSGGVTLTYSVVNNTLIAKAGANQVFTFAVDPQTGVYTFTLTGALDHTDKLLIGGLSVPSAAIDLPGGTYATAASYGQGRSFEGRLADGDAIVQVTNSSGSAVTWTLNNETVGGTDYVLTIAANTTVFVNVGNVSNGTHFSLTGAGAPNGDTVVNPGHEGNVVVISGASALALDLSSAVTARDVDGDTVALHDQLIITVVDDAPTAPTVTVNPVPAGTATLIHDESPGVQPSGNDSNVTHDVGSLPSIFSADAALPAVGTAIGFAQRAGAVSVTPHYGADEAGTTHLALTDNLGAAFFRDTTNFFDTATGNRIFLYTDEAGNVLGRVGSGTALNASAANDSGAVAFAIAIDDSGTLSFVQYRALLDNPSTTDDADDAITLGTGGASPDNAVYVKATSTDSDGDSQSQTAALVVRVQDDGPSIDTPVAGANLVVNGQFSDNAGFGAAMGWGGQTATGTIQGWTISGVGLERNPPNWYVQDPVGGGRVVDLDASPGNVTLSQTFTTLTAGESYTLSFDAAKPAGYDAQVQVWWNGVQVDTITPSGVAFQQFSITVTAGGSNTLEFREVGSADNGGTFLANVTLRASSAIVDEDVLSGNASGQGDASGNASATGSLGIHWGTDAADVVDAGGAQDGTSANAVSDNVSALTKRAVYFTDANTADPDLDPSVTASVGSTAIALKSDGLAVQYQVLENGTKIVGYTGTLAVSDHSNWVFEVSLSDENSGSYQFTLLKPLDHAMAGSEDDITLAFGYTARDADGDRTSSTLTIMVDDDTPIVVADAFTGLEDNDIVGNISTNDAAGADGNAASNPYQVVIGPAHGTLVSFNTATGEFVYRPSENYNGPDSFTYKLTDGDGDASTPVTVALTIQAVNDAPVIDEAISVLSGLVVETGDLVGIDEAGLGGGLEPSMALNAQITGNTTVTDRLASLQVAHADVHGVVAMIQTQLTVNQATAIAIVWDYLDDLYLPNPNQPAVNEAFTRLGVEYAQYLQAGGSPLVDVTAKYLADSNDAGFLPDRLQSLHDNLLGNLGSSALLQRYGSNPTLLAELTALITTTDADLLDRPYYDGQENHAAVGTAVQAWDLANGHVTTATGTLVATDVDTGDTQTWSVNTNAGTYGTFALDATTGVWTYTLDNARAATQALKQGDAPTESFTATVTDHDGATDSVVVTITVNGTNDAPMIGATSVISASVKESGDLVGIDEAGLGGGLEPSMALNAQITGNTTVTDGLASLQVAHADVHSVVAMIQTQLPVNQATAIAIVWDYLDDLYQPNPNQLNVNEAFTRLGVEYAQYLQAGGSPLVDITAKYLPDGIDGGSLPDRLQSLHDNLLGNLGSSALLQRYGSNPTLLAELTALITTTDADLLDRPYYDGQENHAAVGTAVQAWDLANGHVTTAAGTLFAADVDQATGLVWSVNTNAGSYGTFALDATTGAWTYTLDNASTATQALKQGETKTETFKATVTDAFGATDTVNVTITVNGTNDAPMIGTTSVVSASVKESGDLNGITEAGFGGGLEPTVALSAQIAGNTTVTDGLASLQVAHADVHSVVAMIQTQLTVNQATAIAIVWDYLDDLYQPNPNQPAVNEAFTRLGVEYALYLQGGGSPLVDVTAKFIADSNDAGSTADRLQSLHDNLLGNLGSSALLQRYGSNPALLAELTALITTTDADLLDRPYYDGQENHAAVGTAVHNWDLANGHVTTATGTLVAGDVDQASGLVWSANTNAGSYGTFALDATTGQWTYTLDNALSANQALKQGETKTETFKATVTDAFGASDTVDVKVTVNGTNDAPIANNDVFSPLPAGWTLSVENGHIYKFVATANNVEWEQARLDASQLLANNQSYLATITSSAEQNVILGVTNTAAGPQLIAYLGGSDSAVEGQWRWVTGPEAGQAFNFTNWYNDATDHEPNNNAGGTGEDILWFYGGFRNGAWNDAPMTGGLPFGGFQFGYVAEAGAPGSAYAPIDEDHSYSFSSGLLTANDTDVEGDSLTVTAVSATSAKGATVSLVGGTITYNPTSATALQALAEGETATDTFTYTVSDGNGGTSSATVTVTVQGTNDAPVITVDAGDSDYKFLTETDAGLITSGTLSVTDVDVTDIVNATVLSVNAGGSGIESMYTPAQLLGFFTLGANPVDTNASTTGDISWTFNSGNEAFNFLPNGWESVINYTVQVSDGHGGTDTQVVQIKLHGTNDAPVISANEQTINVVNAGFEADTTYNQSGSEGQYTNGSPAGWTVSGPSYGGWFDPGPNGPAGAAGVLPMEAGNGNNVLWLNDGQTASQTLATTAAAGTYDLSVEIGDRRDGTLTGLPQFAVRLYAGNTLVAEEIVPAQTADGDAWHTIALQGLIAAGSPLVGQPLRIELQNLETLGAGGDFPQMVQVNFDNVSLVHAAFTTPLTGINEDAINNLGQTVASILGSTVGDADAGAVEGIAIIAADDGNGTWQFKDAGGTWVDFGSYSVGAALLLRATDMVRFVPNQITGTTAGFDYAAWDQTSGAAFGTANVTNRGGTTAYSTQTAHAVITVTDVNDVPVVDLHTGQAGNDALIVYTEQMPQWFANYATISDVDSATLQSMTVTLTARPNGDSAETLSLNLAATTALTNAGLSFGYNAATGVLSITGSALVAVYQTVLKGVVYNNTSDAPITSDRSVTVVVNDGADNSVVHTATIQVHALNDAPVLTGDRAATINEGATYQLTLADLNFTDPDNTAGQVSFIVSNQSHGVVMLGGVPSLSFTGQQLADGLVTFKHDGLEGSSATFDVKVEDGNQDGSPPVSQTFTFTVNNVNDAPTDIALDNLAVAPGNDFGDTVANVTVTDSDDTAFTFVVRNPGGSTSQDLAVVGTPGHYTLMVINENGVGSLPPSVTITATDAGGLSHSEAFVLTAPVQLFDVSNHLLGYFTTIQGAVNAAHDGAGEYIKAAAGTYAENVTIDRGVEIRGANYGLDGTAPGRGAETIIQGQVTVTGGTGEAVQIDGVEVRNTSNLATQFIGIRVENTAADVTIENSVFYSTGPNGNADDRGINVGPGATGHVTIDDNLFTGTQQGAGNMFSTANWHRGVWTNGGTSELDITGNTFDNVRSALNLNGFDNNASDVSGNTFQDSGSGVTLGSDFVGQLTAVHDNVFNNVGDDVNLQNATGTVTFDANATHNSATGGTPEFVVDGGQGADTLVGTSGEDVLIGHALDSHVGGDSNSLTGLGGNDRLIGANGAGFDTATYAGTLTAADISVVATDTNAFVGGVQAGWSVNAGAEGTDTLSEVERVVDGSGHRFLLVGNGGFATIQAAVNMAQDGDTILVAAGTYAENVTINSIDGLTIKGVGGTVEVDGQFSVTGTLDGGLKLEDITIDAAGHQYGLFVSASSTGAAGSISLDGVTIENATQNGLAYIRTGNGSTPTQADTIGAVTIVDSHFNDNGIGATGGSGDILLYGFNGDLTLTDVTISGKDTAGGGAQKAIQVRGVQDGSDTVNVGPFDAFGDVIIDGLTITGNYTQDLVSFYRIANFTSLTTTDVTLNASAPWGLLNFDEVGGIIDLSHGITGTNSSGPIGKLQGLLSDNTFTGTAGNDTLIGRGGADTMHGGAGDDTFLYAVGDGADIIDGGSETSAFNPNYDILTVLGDGEARTITIGKATSGTDIVPTTGSNTTDVEITYTGTNGTTLRADEIEHIDIVAGAGAINLVVGDVSGTSILPSTIVFTGGAGDDKLDLSNFAGDVHVVFKGNGGTDKLVLGNIDWKDVEVTRNPDGSYTIKHGTQTFDVDGTENFQFAGGVTATAAQLLQQAPGNVTVTGSSVNENTAANVLVATVAATDANGEVDPLHYAFVSGGTTSQNSADGKFTIDAATGEIRTTGAAIDYEQAHSFAETVRVTDSKGAFVDKAFSIAVNDLNDVAPAITSADTASTPENVAISQTVYQAVVSDADTVGTLSYSLTGTDAGLFDISANGAVTFKTSPNFEAPADNGGNNVYNIVVNVSDGANAVASKAVAITVSGLNEAPDAVDDGSGGGVSGTFTENFNDGDISAWAEVSLGNSSANWHGVPSNVFFSGDVVEASNNGQGFLRAPTGGLPIGSAASTAYTIEVDADPNVEYFFGIGDSTRNEAVGLVFGHVDTNNYYRAYWSHFGTGEWTDPDYRDLVIERVSNGNVTVLDRVNNVDLGWGTIHFKVEVDANGIEVTFTGDNETVTLTASGSPALGGYGLYTNDNDDGIAYDNFSVSVGAGGIVTGEDTSVNISAASVLSNDTDVDGDTLSIQSVSNTSTHGGSVSYNSGTGQITYTPAADYNGTDSFTYTVTDGNGGTDTATVTLNVTPVNDAPVIVLPNGGNPTTLVVNENKTAVTTVVATDGDSANLTYSLVAGGDSGKFSIDATTGALTFKNAPDFESPGDANGDNTYDVQVQVSDGVLTDTQTLHVQVADVDDTPPTITISDNKTGTTNGAVTYTFQFSEAVTGFDAGDIVVSNGTKGAFTAIDGDTYTLVVTPAAGLEGNMTVAVAANVATDAANNGNVAASDSSQAFDTKAPTVSSIAMSDTALKSGETSTVTITFSEAVSGFDNTDVTVQNGTLGTLTTANGGVTWTGTFTPTSNIEDTTNIVSVASSYTDAAGNAGSAGTSANYTVDTKA